jgi:hypothetical protein
VFSRSSEKLAACLLSLALCPAVLASPAPVAHPERTDFELKDGDRVVFYGDSITEQRLYTTYVEQYVLTRYPDRVQASRPAHPNGSCAPSGIDVVGKVVRARIRGRGEGANQRTKNPISCGVGSTDSCSYRRPATFTASIFAWKLLARLS